MRVVLDTNVLISAIFWTGKPKDILNVVRKRKVVFVTSQVLLDSNKPFQLEEKDAERVVRHIKNLAEIIRVTNRVTVCKHEADNCVLECAFCGKADYIITGDKDLLGLKSFEGIKIIKAAGFLNIIHEEN